MRNSHIIGRTVCVALLAGVIGTGTMFAGQKGRNSNAQGNSDDSESNSGNASCSGLPDQSALEVALDAATLAEASGLNNQMWGTIVDRDGVVCAVAFSGADRGAQWPGSRVISAQKASTANAFSLDSSSSPDMPRVTPTGWRSRPRIFTPLCRMAAPCSDSSSATRWIQRSPIRDHPSITGPPTIRWSDARLAG